MGFPAKETVYKYLKAGQIDNTSYSNTDVSNIALNGMELKLGVRYNIDIGNHHQL